MTIAVVKETYTSAPENESGVKMKVIIEDSQEIDLLLSRDVAIRLIEQLYNSLNGNGLKTLHDFH